MYTLSFYFSPYILHYIIIQILIAHITGFTSNVDLREAINTRNCSVHLKAEMNNYRGINECKFLVQAIFDSNPIQESTGSKHTLILGPLTRNKKNKNKASTAEDSNTDYHTTSPESDAEMNTDNTPPTKAKED